MRWLRDDVNALGFKTAEQYAAWLRSGLLAWADRHELPFAFAPLAHRFDSTDDPEPQLGKMFAVMPERHRQLLANGLSIALEECEASDDGRALFNALQRVIQAIDRPEPIDAMVNRICAAGFLDEKDDADFSQHVYASAFLVLRSVARAHDTRLQALRLRRSSRFRPEYAPFVLSVLLQKAPTECFSALAELRDDLLESGAIERVADTLRSSLNRMSVADFLVAARAPVFGNVAEDKELAPLAEMAMEEQVQELGETLAQAAQGAQGMSGRAPAEELRTIDEIYSSLPNSNRKWLRDLIKRRRRSARPHLWSPSRAQGFIEVVAVVGRRREKARERA
jgi:hypothetical protein